jgi:putative transcriptional regulator
MSFSQAMHHPLSNHRRAGGKITLRTHDVDLSSLNPLMPEQIKAIRQKMNMSRSIFARKLRTSPRTLERWEQGISKPNQQAAVLMLLVISFNDMLERIASLGQSSS